jgi:VanZ family protein
MSSESQSTSPAPWRWRIACGVYLAVLFAATHIPLEMKGLSVHNNDKLLHFAAYGGLGALFGWQAGRASFWRRAAWLAWGAILCWAAVDELTQPWFHRTFDVYDWLADAGGSALGVIAGLSVHTGIQPVEADVPLG